MKTIGIGHHASIRLTRFSMKIIGMWYVENLRDQMIANSILFYVLVTMIIALIVEGFDCYYSWGDLRAITYTAPCTITVILELFKLLVFIKYRRKVMDLNAFTDFTFWKIKYEIPDARILDKCNQRSIIAFIAFAFLMQLICWHYLTIPIVESIGKNDSDRSLPFNLWFNFPFTETPYYEIAFGFQSAATMSVSICAITFSTFLFTINVYAAGQFQIIQRKLELSFNESKVGDILSNRVFINLKSCIKQHQQMINYMDKIEDLYCPMMFGQALGSVLQICFSGFQIVLGAESSILRTALSIEFFFGSSILLFMSCWSCHQVIIESMAVGDAAYRACWYNLICTKDGILCSRSLMFVVARARRPCVITVGKFAPMSLDTFTSALSSSISYFTILRQMNDDAGADGGK